MELCRVLHATCAFSPTLLRAGVLSDVNADGTTYWFISAINSATLLAWRLASTASTSSDFVAEVGTTDCRLDFQIPFGK